MIELALGSALDNWKFFPDLVDLNLEDLSPFQYLPSDLTPATLMSWEKQCILIG